jgi:hypothetical protein
VEPSKATPQEIAASLALAPNQVEGSIGSAVEAVEDWLWKHQIELRTVHLDDEWCISRDLRPRGRVV